MSDLQVGLLVLGLLLIAGVMSYNWWQQRRWHRHLHVDSPLMDPVNPGNVSAPPVLTEARIEPHLKGEHPDVDSREDGEAPASAADSVLDFVMEVRAGEVIPAVGLKALRAVLLSSPKRVQISGFNYQNREWETVAADPGAAYTMVRVAMQMVDRSGAVTFPQLEEFAAFVNDFAGTYQAVVQAADIQAEMERATSLDRFCAEVDVVVGINVVAPTGQFFHGSKIRSLADGMGLKLQGKGGFHCIAEDGGVLFTLDNQEHKPFLPDQIRSMTTSGLTFLLDVPRTADGIQTFNRMVSMAKSCAESLDGILADDNRVTLSDAGLDKIRDQLRTLYAAMDSRGIAPGTPTALRLFS